jgi:hypothetical protein
VLDVVEDRGDLVDVVGVLVRKHQCRRGFDGAGFVSMDAVDLVGPFPATGIEVKTKPAHPIRRRSSVRTADRERLSTVHGKDVIGRWTGESGFGAP